MSGSNQPNGPFSSLSSASLVYPKMQGNKLRKRHRDSEESTVLNFTSGVPIWLNLFVVVSKLSSGVLGGATAAWVLFELMEYHLLTLLCHVMIVLLPVLFLWSNATMFINKSPPKIPEVHIPEEPIVQLASGLWIEINRGFSSLREIASGRNLKKFLIAVVGLWVLSVFGGWFSFLTLAYIALVLLFTVPLTYDKYEDKVDPLGEKAMIEIKKQYAGLDEKGLSKIPMGLLKNKKRD